MANENTQDEPTEVDASGSSHCSAASVLMVQMPFGANDWYQVPRRYDTLWLSRCRPLPCYESDWSPYFETLRDLLLAGF
jgi:hypothetical protein